MGFFTNLASRLVSQPEAPVERVHGEPNAGGAGSVVGTQTLSTQYQRVGGNLTPGKISTILNKADDGDISQLMDLAFESRQKDGHLHSVLQTREEALRGLPFEVAAPTPMGTAKEPDLAEVDAARRCQRAITSPKSWPELLKHLQGALYLGHDTDEIFWSMTEHEDGPPSLDPQKYEHVSPRRMRFRQSDGKLVFGTGQGGMGAQLDLLEEYPDRFIQYQPVVTGDQPAREGLVRLLVWPALFRNWSTRDWLQLGEIGWKPYRFGKFKAGASKDTIANLRSIMTAITTTGSVVHPNNVEIEVEWPKGQIQQTTSSHHELHSTFGEEISKATIGQTLTTEAGARGARSLGEVHQLVREDLVEADAVAVAGVVQTFLVDVWYRFNAPSIRKGRAIFHTADTMDHDSFSRSLTQYGEAGLKVPEVWAHDKAGIPMPTEGESVLEPPGGNDDAKEITEPEKKAA